MSAGEALPAIEIPAGGPEWRCIFQRRGDGRGEEIPARLEHLCALVAALPDEQLIDVAKAAGFFESGKRVADFGFAQMRAKQDAMKERDAALAENARLREELAHADRAHNTAIVALNTWWKAACCPDAPGVRDEATRAVHEYYRRAAPYLKERHTP